MTKEKRRVEKEDNLLTIREKREWLAEIFRNADGEYCQADRFKALVEDTKLAGIQKEEETDGQKGHTAGCGEKLYALFKSLPLPDPVLSRTSSETP